MHDLHPEIANLRRAVMTFSFRAQAARRPRFDDYRLAPASSIFTTTIERVRVYPDLRPCVDMRRPGRLDGRIYRKPASLGFESSWSWRCSTPCSRSQAASGLVLAVLISAYRRGAVPIARNLSAYLLEAHACTRPASCLDFRTRRHISDRPRDLIGAIIVSRCALGYWRRYHPTPPTTISSPNAGDHRYLIGLSAAVAVSRRASSNLERQRGGSSDVDYLVAYAACRKWILGKPPPCFFMVLICSSIPHCQLGLITHQSFGKFNLALGARPCCSARSRVRWLLIRILSRLFEKTVLVPERRRGNSMIVPSGRCRAVIRQLPAVWFWIWVD